MVVRATLQARAASLRVSLAIAGPQPGMDGIIARSFTLDDLPIEIGGLGVEHHRLRIGEYRASPFDRFRTIVIALRQFLFLLTGAALPPVGEVIAPHLGV